MIGTDHQILNHLVKTEDEGVTLAGYTLGSSVKHIDRYLVPVILVVVGVSLIPVALELRRASKDSTRG